MSGLMEMEDEQGKKLCDDEIVDSIVSLVVAGYESTANAIMVGGLYHLAKSPHALHKLREENNALNRDKNGGFISLDDIPSMKYTAKGLQDKMELVAIDLQDKPAWYKEKVYPQGTVPSLEHDNEIRGESLDLIKYIDSNFDGPTLLPEDAAKRQFADELIAHANAFTKALYSPLMAHAAVSDEVVAALDKLEAELSKFNDGPFFLGQFSLADIAYVTILERVQIYYSHLRNYDITKGRPNLEKFIEEMNKIEAYTQTKKDPLFLLDLAKNHLKIA